MFDKRGRNIHYLRVSVTDRCNLRCVYCLPEQGVRQKEHEDILRYEEVLLVVEAARDQGFDTVRITGGEPLVRKGIIGFVSRVASVPGIVDVSLTTNGVLLADAAEDLWAAGVRRLNISLDSLKRDRFRSITRRDEFDAVWRGIEKAAEVGFDPIKINVVVMKGVNHDEIPEFARLTLKEPFHVRFIEIMPLGDAGGLWSSFVSAEEIARKLREAGQLEPCARPAGAGPARYLRLPGGKGTVGVIDAMSRHFCGSCNRLRLTADGKIHPCLAADVEVDVRSTLRNMTGSAARESLRASIKRAVSLKPNGHDMRFAVAADGGFPVPEREGSTERPAGLEDGICSGSGPWLTGRGRCMWRLGG